MQCDECSVPAPGLYARNSPAPHSSAAGRRCRGDAHSTGGPGLQEPRSPPITAGQGPPSATTRQVGFSITSWIQALPSSQTVLGAAVFVRVPPVLSGRNICPLTDRMGGREPAFLPRRLQAPAPPLRGQGPGIRGGLGREEPLLADLPSPRQGSQMEESGRDSGVRVTRLPLLST